MHLERTLVFCSPEKQAQRWRQQLESLSIHATIEFLDAPTIALLPSLHIEGGHVTLARHATLAEALKALASFTSTPHR